MLREFGHTNISFRVRRRTLKGGNKVAFDLTKALLNLPTPDVVAPVAHLLYSRKQDSGVMDNNPEAGGHYDLLQPLKPAAPSIV